MSTLRASRPVAVLLLVTLWPALGIAQSAPPAGVVTGIQGTARLVRPVVTQPIPLKFKDDLFLRDQVDTAENSVVRVLLGGKALVTIRELSTFAITEEPGRAAVDLKSGKIAVGVAKSLLKAGEVIEIRTPNAIAAVRGSLLIASVATVGGVLQSSFTALDASLPITVTPVGGTGLPVALNANQAVGVSGIGTSTAVGPVQNITPDVARREAQTATAPREVDQQGTSSPMASEISVAKAQEAAVLASLIAPPPTGAAPPPSDTTLTSATQTQLLQEEGSTLTTASQTVVSSTPPPPSTGDLGVNATAATSTTSESSPPASSTPPDSETPPGDGTGEVPPGDGGGTTPGGGTPPGGGSGPVVISNQNLTLAADQTLKTYSGQSFSADTTAAVTVTNSTVTGAGNLIVVEPGAEASLAGPLLNVTGAAGSPSALTANSAVVDIRGILSSLTTGSFISIDPTIVTTTDFLRIAGGSLTLAGPLLTDAQGIYAVTGDFLSVQQGGTLTAIGSSPLLQFSGSVVGLGGAAGSQNPNRFLALGGAGSTVSLSGSLVSLTNNSALGIGGPTGSALVAIAPGGTLTASAASPLVDLSGSALALGLGVRGLLATGGTVSVGGSFLRAAAGSNIIGDLNVPVVDLTNAAVDITGALVRLEGGSLLQGGGVKVTGGSLTAAAVVSTDGNGNNWAIAGPVLDLANTSVTLGTLRDKSPGAIAITRILAPNEPALRLSGSTLALTNVNDTVLALPETGFAGIGVITSGTPTVPSTINLKGTLLRLDTGGNYSATQAMVQLDRTSLNQTDTTNDLISMGPSATTMAGALLSVTNSTVDTNGRLAHFAAGVLTSGTTAPFLFFDPSSITSAQQMIQLDSGFNLTLSGPLVSAQSTAFSVNSPAVNAFGFVTLLDGAKLTGTGTGSLLVFDASSFDGGTVLSVRRSTSTLNRSRLTLAGPLFSAVNGSSFNTSSIALGPSLGTAGGPCCSLVSVTQGGQLLSTTASPLIEVSGSEVVAGPDAQSGGTIVNLADTFGGAPAAELVAPSSVTLAGPLLRAENSTLTALFHLLRIGNSSLVSTSTDALVQISNSTVSLGGLDPFTNATSAARLLSLSGSAASPATLTLQGPLFSAVNSALTSTGAMVGVLDGAILTSSTQAPIIAISGGSALAAVSGPGDGFIRVSSSLGPPSAIGLSGPLLAASNTVLRNGDPSSNVFSFLFIGDSSTVTSTGTGALLAFDNTNLDTAASILSLRRSLSTATPTKLTLAGPLFVATNGSTFNTTSLGLGSACCDAFGVRQAAELTSTSAAPLIQLSGSTFNAGPDVQSGGNFFGMSDDSIDGPVTAPAKVSLAGPLLSANGSSISALFNLLSVGRSSLSSTSPAPLIQMNGTTLTLGGLNPFTGLPSAGRLVSLFSTAATPTSVTLGGALFRAVDSTISATDDMFGIFDKTTLTSTTTDPLISFNGGSASAGGPSGNFIVVASGQDLSPTVSLAGPLLDVVNATVTSGNPTNSVPTFVFIGDSAKVSSTSGAPLLSFDHATVDGAGGLVVLRRSLSAADPTKLTLSGPLFAATNGSNINVTSLGFGSACCSGIFIGQAAELTSSGTGALVQLVSSTFNAGPDAQSGGTFFGVFDTGACCSDTNLLVAPSKVTLSGPLLSATNSNISTLFDLLTVARSGLSRASAAPLIQLSGATVSLGGLNSFGNQQTFGRLVGLVSSATAGSVGSPASLSLTGAGPLLLATNSNLTTSSDVIGIFNGGTFSSATTAPLIQLNGGTVTTQSTGIFGGYVLLVSGTGGPTGGTFASAELGGALLNTTGALNLSGGLVNVFSGGQVTSTGSTNPFVFVNGGVHAIAGAANPGSAMVGLAGRSTALALDAESQLFLGIDRPIQGALQLDGTRPMLTPLLETSGATVTGQKVLRIDSALLEATAPLLNLAANGATQSVLTTTGTNAVDLSFQARVSALGDSLVRLDNSVLNVMNGSLVNVNASKLTLGGDLVSLLNGATLSLLNGPLLTVSGNGFANITGGLIGFGGTGGNTVNVTNNLCPCSLFGGVPVALQNGALAANVLISSPIKNPTLGALNLSPNAALAVVNGAGSKLIVGSQ